MRRARRLAANAPRKGAPMGNSLQDKIALVTGGSTGIGLGIAKRFVSDGETSNCDKISVNSWRTGRCVPWWRNRHGYDCIELWPPANLSQLGRRGGGTRP